MKKVILATMLAFGVASVGYAADAKKPAKVDCSVKKNANKLECKKAPTSNVKPKAEKPKKVERKAPASVQKKAEANKK